MKSLNRIALPFIILHTVIYYYWICFWKNDPWTLALGGNIICLIGVITALLFMIVTIVRSKGKQKYFWLLLALGNFCYLISELIWDYYELILKVDAPSPGWADIFCYMQVLLAIIAIAYKFHEKKHDFKAAKFIFDSFIVMAVVTTIIWNYIIGPLFSQSESFLTIIVSIGYPIGDLGILFGIISLFMSSNLMFPRKVMQLLSIGLVIQSVGDLWYAFSSLTNAYVFGSLFDPLWALSAMTIAFAGLIYSVKDNESLNTENILEHQKTDKLRLLLPYISILILLIIILTTDQKITSLFIGFTITILLMIVRQIFTLSENQHLLRQFHELNKNLEDKVTDRTIELTVLNTELTTVNTELSQANKMFSHLSYYDSLTGLQNRSSINKIIPNLISLHLKFAVLFLDLDNFKHINDSMGHSMGDILLKKIAQHLKSVVRSTDIVARSGGDEFMIILKEIKSREIVVEIAQHIIDSFKTSIRLNDYDLIVSTSIGIALYPDDGEDIELLVKNSDIAMYEAKKQGRNRYYFSKEIHDNKLTDRLKLIRHLHFALEKNEFRLYIQPKFNITTLEIIGGEVLLRWVHPELGFVLPGIFISLTEETGLIVPISEWILKTAFQQIKDWSDNYSLENIRFSINVSPLQFLQNNMVSFVKDCLNEIKLDAKYIELEITENIALQNSENVLSKLHQIKDLGIEISIDDFGTGYSSMSYLSKYPINTLKIDISFVRVLTKNKENEAIVTAIIAMAHSLNLKVIAEGIETEEQLQILREKKCDFGQGYLIGKPMALSEFEEKFIKK